MSHEMTENDSAVYFAKPAWHGLGKVIENPFSISDALEQADLGWKVSKSNGILTNTPLMSYSDDHHTIIRQDTSDILGIVGSNYKVLQNEEVFRLAECFGKDVKVESAGSVQNGSKVYLLLKGETFDAVYNDAVNKYMALFWSHDGSMSMTALPTSVRVVCKNTLDMVIGQADKATNKISIKHAGNMEEKMDAARDAVMRYNEVGTFFENTVKVLGRTEPTVEDVKKFFVSVYQMLNDVTIVNNPTNEEEEAEKVKAAVEISSWTNTFEEEAKDFGINLWIAANSVTNHIQHRVATRGRKKTPASAAYSNLIGTNAKDSTKVFRSALQLVG